MLTEFADTAEKSRDAHAQDRLRELGVRMPYTVAFADAEGNYHNKMRTRYMQMWEALPFTPDELVDMVSEGVVGGQDNLVLRDLYIEPEFENGVLMGMKLESKFVPAEYKDDPPSYSPYLNNDREYDFVRGLCFKGDVRSSGLKEPGVGRLGVRNTLQIGHRLGCPHVKIDATRVGCALWLKGDAYEVESVNPKYLANVQKRWAAIEPHVSDVLDTTAVSAAIEHGDLKALSRINADVRSALTQTSGGVFPHLQLCDANEDIPLNRYLLFDLMIECWQGVSNMDDPHQRKELGKLLGGWTDETLLAEPEQSAVRSAEVSAGHRAPHV